LKAVDVQGYGEQHGGYNLQDDGFQPEDIIPDNWQEIVKTEKGLQTGFSQPTSVVDNSDNSRLIYLQDGQEYDDQDDIDTVGQRGEHAIPENQNHIGNEQDHYVEEVPEPAPSQSWSNQMPPPLPPPPQLRFTSTFKTNSIPTNKSSSYVEGPEDEAAPTRPVAKKAQVVLDYDPQALKTMSYTDLDKRPFEEDPRTSNTIPPIDEHGIPLTLHRRLGNLSRMKDEDVRAMFLCQSDQEWEDTGAWFIGQFETQTRRLMDIRQERRMIALKFEMEVKRRQAAVAAKMGDVEQELRYLKAGGRDLMDKRVSPTA
jgi:Extracellular mutant protein 11